MHKALQALDNFSSGVLDAIGVFRGAGWGVMIGDEGRSLVAVVKIKEADDLGCDCVRESEHRGRNASQIPRHCLVGNHSVVLLFTIS